MIPDFLAPGIVIGAPDKTSARESGDAVSWYYEYALTYAGPRFTTQ